jgi:hypothetical protein
LSDVLFYRSRLSRRDLETVEARAAHAHLIILPKPSVIINDDDDALIPILHQRHARGRGGFLARSLVNKGDVNRSTRTRYYTDTVMYSPCWSPKMNRAPDFKFSVLRRNLAKTAF